MPPPACGAAQPWAIARRVAAPAGILQNILDNGEKKINSGSEQDTRGLR